VHALREQLSRWIGIPEAKVGLVLRRVGFHAVFVAGVTQVKSASNALYLAHRDPGGLAYLYIALAATVALASFVVSRGLARRRPLWLLRIGGAIAAAVLIALCGMVYLHLAEGYAVIYVVGELYATMLSVLFWADALERFDLRVQKRIVGLLAAGGNIGAIVGGALVRPLAGSVGVASMLALAGMTLVVTLPMLGNDYRERRQRARGENAAASSGQTALSMVRQSFPRSIALLVAALAVLATLVDYHFRFASANLLTESAMATLFGDLNVAIGVAGIVFQTLVTRRLLSSFGVFVFLGTVPALIGVMALGELAWPFFALIVLLKGVEMAGSYSLYQPGLQLLYNPLAAEQRQTLRPFVDGAAKKMGVAAGGIGLLLLAASDNRFVVTGAIVTCAVIILLLIRAVRLGYVATLEQRLGVQRQQVHFEIDPADRVTRRALTRALRSDQPRAVLTALSVLERDPAWDPAGSLLHLLSHNDPSVRLAAIERAGRTHDPQIATALRAILATDQRRPRAHAARILPLVDPDHAAEALRPYLHDADPGVRVAVAGALLPLEPEGEGPAHAVLGSLLGGADQTPPVRRELAKLLGDLGEHSFLPTLVQLLHDPEPSVRRLACRSAAKLRHPDLVDEMIGLHSDRHARGAARLALAAYGDAVVPRLEQVLNDRTAPLGLRLEAPRVLRAIGTDAAAGVLLFSNIADNATLRYRIASALFEMKRAHPDLKLDATRVDEAALRRLHAYRYYRPTLRALQVAKHPAYAPLVRALGDRVSQNLEMALRLIGLLRDGDLMMRIFACLDERGSVLHAEAFELIDVALSGDRMRAWLLDFVEEETQPGTLPEHELRTLLSSRDPLLRGLAEVVAEKLGVVVAVDERGDLVDMEGETMERPFIERMLLLESVDLFAKLSTDDLSAIAAIAGEREFEPGALIYREGEPGDVMFVIIEGAVDLLKAGNSILQLHAGESLGQTSIMDAGPRPVTARVVDGGAGAKLLAIERAAFMDLCSDRFELVTGLFVVMGQRIRALIDQAGGNHP